MARALAAPSTRRQSLPLHLELADDDALAAFALDAERSAPILLRRRREAARQPQHQAGAARQHLLAMAEEVGLDAVLARLSELERELLGPVAAGRVVGDRAAL